MDVIAPFDTSPSDVTIANNVVTSRNPPLPSEQFGLLPYFDHVQGTDGFPCKPAPDVIFTSGLWSIGQI